MTNDLPHLERLVRNADARPRRVTDRLDYATLIADLELLRQLVIERLGSIEQLAEEKAAALRRSRASEEALKLESGEVEESRRKLLEQTERQRKEWEAALERLESDRRLLAEAWERVENERVDAMGLREDQRVHPGSDHIQGAGSSRQLGRAGAPAQVRPSSTHSDAYNPVAQAILQQFQTLCSDVRRSANARRAAR
jgi:hypothetical protein